MMDQLRIKEQNLKKQLQSLGRLAVAFSGGVDSTFLLKEAHEVLGDQVLAVTACSAFIPERERKEAIDFCQREGIRHILCSIDILAEERVAENPRDRCYLCKKEIFSQLIEAAGMEGIEHLAEGSNVDDLSDYRPGLRAIAELGVLSPLQKAGLTKAEIRQLSRQHGLATWEKPSFACLASRFVYGERITEERLAMVDQAEQFLLEQGLRQFRVRIHGTLARIEVLPEEFSRVMDEKMRSAITEKLSEIGFSYVTLDLQGYRTGSMNEVLENN